MATGCLFTPLADMIREIERRLSEDNGGVEMNLVVLDRVDVLAAAPDTKANRAVAVLPGSSRNTGEYRDRALARVEDTITVVLCSRIRPKDQTQSRDEALTLEEQIRARLTDSVWERPQRIAYVGTTSRSTHPKSAEWYVITQQFTAQRDALLGG